jgi:hypothetical protein
MPGASVSQSRFLPRAASALLAPPFVLFVICLTIVVTAFTSPTWAESLFWAVIVLVAAASILVLAGAKPLPAIASKSHLFKRLSWLLRYAIATTLLCLSTFLGALAGFTAGGTDGQLLVNGAEALVGEVAIWAVRIGAVLFFGWLSVDFFRMSLSRRRKGIRRSIGKMLGSTERSGTKTSAVHPVVMNWLVVLTSPLLATASFGALAISLLLALRGAP